MGIARRLVLEGRAGFLQAVLALFCVEWVRGAFLVSFLPAHAADRWGLSAAVVGAAVSAHYLTDNLTKSFAGLLLDRYPAAIVLHAGHALAAGGLALLLLVPAPWTALAASAMMGAGFSPIWLVCLGGIRQENRAEEMGFLYVFWLAGLGLGPVSVNFMLDLGDRPAWALIACMLAAGWLLSGMADGPSASPAAVRMPVRAQLRMLWDRIRRAGILIPGMLLQTTAAGMIVPFLSVFAVNRLALSHVQFSALLMTGGAFAVLTLVPMGKWFDRIGGKWFLVAGFGVFTLALIGLTHVRSFLPAAGAAVLMGVSYAALLPAWNALMAKYIPHESQGAGWGVFSSVEGLGVIVGPLVGSWLAGDGNVAVPFWAGALMFGLMTVFYLLTPSVLFRTELSPSRR